MKADTHQTDSLLNAPQPGAEASNGAASTAGSHPRPLGQQAVTNLVIKMDKAKKLSPHKREMLLVTARLIIHLKNASNRLYREGELTAEGEPKQLLARVQDLARQIKGNLEDIFGDDAGDDPISRLLGQPR